VIRRIWVLTCSTRAFDKLLVSAASTLERWSVIVLASLTNGSSRQRLAHFSQLSSSLMASAAGSW
jgi:hypothetical protein